MCKKHGLDYHLYADDSQIYIAFSPHAGSDLRTVICRIEACVADIKKWMVENRLMLNDDKTEVMIITTKQQWKKLNCPDVQIGEHTISPAKKVRNLGVAFDATLSRADHINQVVRSTNLQLRNIGQIRKYLNTKATQTLIHSLIFTRLDYCNTLYYGLPMSLLNKLQRVQNSAARLLTGTK